MSRETQEYPSQPSPFPKEPPPGQSNQDHHIYPPQKQRVGMSGFANASMILGIIGVFFFWFSLAPFITLWDSVFAIVLSLAISSLISLLAIIFATNVMTAHKIKPGRGRGQAITGLTTGIVGFMLPLFFVYFAIAFGVAIAVSVSQ